MLKMLNLNKFSLFKFLLLVAACILLITSLTSCTDSTEVNDMTYVIVVGIDKGIINKWRLTVEFSTMKSNNGNSGGQTSDGKNGSSTGNASQNDYTTVTVDAPSFFAGINIINTLVSRKLNFAHTKMIVISDEVAKDGLLGQFIAPIIRYRQMRRTSHVVISKGPAVEFVKACKLLIGKTLSTSIETIIEESQRSGFFPHVTLGRFYNNIKSFFY
ncbi:MAG TPA: hypothetical protein PK733_15755 [Clostridiales bacterium]|nr:hypothetical protein [Clostridiales bacterium]